MAEEVKIWSIQQGNKLRELQKSRLDLEERIEDWVSEDISILSNDLLVIGRQLPTDFGGFLDLLCLNSNGDTVIVELKRHKTPGLC
jgi:RecB family endonuclease NucS